MSDAKRVLDALADELAPRLQELVYPATNPRSVEKPMNLDELAEHTGISRSTLAELARCRQIPCFRAGKRVIFLASEVLETLRIPAETKGGAL